MLSMFTDNVFTYSSSMFVSKQGIKRISLTLKLFIIFIYYSPILRVNDKADMNIKEYD
jgi:hypothetical protein